MCQRLSLEFQCGMFSGQCLGLYSIMDSKSRCSDLFVRFASRNLRCAQVSLTVVSAKGLGKVDLYGLSDPFAVVFLNGREVGRTRTLYKTVDPHWTDPEETFVLQLASGGPPCRAMVEVWDEDQGGYRVNSAGDGGDAEDDIGVCPLEKYDTLGATWLKAGSSGARPEIGYTWASTYSGTLYRRSRLTTVVVANDELHHEFVLGVVRRCSTVHGLRIGPVFTTRWVMVSPPRVLPSRTRNDDIQVLMRAR